MALLHAYLEDKIIIELSSVCKLAKSKRNLYSAQQFKQEKRRKEKNKHETRREKSDRI